MYEEGDGKKGVMIFLVGGGTTSPIVYTSIALEVDSSKTVQLLKIRDVVGTEYIFNMRHVVGYIIQRVEKFEAAKNPQEDEGQIKPFSRMTN